MTKPPKPKARDRVLSDDELTAIWHAADEIGYPFGALVQLLVLTAQRRNEVATMRWQDIDLNDHVWAIPGELTKNGKPHLVPLSGLTSAQIASLPRLHESSLFPTRRNDSTTFSGFSKLKAKIDQLSNVQGWTLHDLGRSAATHMSRVGVGPHIVERILNHESGSFRGVAGVYNRFHYLPEMREALERWAKHIKECIGT